MTAGRPPVDVVVVGGGIGGLSQAVALCGAGLSVRILEQTAEFGEVGAGLQIAPNCTRILADWGLLEEVSALGVTPAHLVMRDAVDGAELTRLDLGDARARYGSPYVVIHRSDLHATLRAEAERLGAELVTSCAVTSVEPTADGAVAISDERADAARVVLAADGLRSVTRRQFSDDEPVSSNYVAYRGAVPVEDLDGAGVSLDDVVVYVGPRCHLVQYPLRGGELFNQVAVFESPSARAGVEEWGTPDELDAAFARTCYEVRTGLSHVWRHRSWRMYDRDPIQTWVKDRVALTGDAAHPPLQYLAQGAVMAMEDAWVLAAQANRHRRHDGTVAWDAALQGYQAVRVEHTARVINTARSWGRLWHLEGQPRLERNRVLRERATRDYHFVDWLYGPTATGLADLPPMFTAQH